MYNLLFLEIPGEKFNCGSTTGDLGSSDLSDRICVECSLAAFACKADLTWIAYAVDYGPQQQQPRRLQLPSYCWY